MPDVATCTCDDEPDRLARDCPLHVDCDQDCRALRAAATYDEIGAAYRHWRYHGYLHGCAHGC